MEEFAPPPSCITADYPVPSPCHAIDTAAGSPSPGMPSLYPSACTSPTLISLIPFWNAASWICCVLLYYIISVVYAVLLAAVAILNQRNHHPAGHNCMIDQLVTDICSSEQLCKVIKPSLASRQPKYDRAGDSLLHGSCISFDISVQVIFTKCFVLGAQKSWRKQADC